MDLYDELEDYIKSLECTTVAMGLRPGVSKRPLESLSIGREVDDVEPPSPKLICRSEHPKGLNGGNDVVMYVATEDEEEEESEEEDEDEEDWNKKDPSWNCDVSGSILARTLLSGPPPCVRSSSYSSTSNELQTYYNNTTSRLPPVSTIAYRGMNHLDRDTSSPIPQGNYGGGQQYWGDYYSGSVQTVQCEETGKSYFQLGNVSPSYVESSGSLQEYRQQLLSMLQLSMCKLHRTRQVQDPRLRRSVLIYNTLRRLEREMAREGFRPSTFQNSVSNNVYEMNPPSPPPSPAPYEHSLRDLGAGARATPFPSPMREDTDSGIGEEVDSSTINWGSVLSLTTQTDLDSLNNNSLGELTYPSTSVSSSETSSSTSTMWRNQDDSGLDDFLSNSKVVPTGAHDVLKSVPTETAVPIRGKIDLFTEDLDKIMHVLVGT